MLGPQNGRFGGLPLKCPNPFNGLPFASEYVLLSPVGFEGNLSLLFFFFFFFFYRGLTQMEVECPASGGTSAERSQATLFSVSRLDLPTSGERGAALAVLGSGSLQGSDKCWSKIINAVCVC